MTKDEKDFLIYLLEDQKGKARLKPGTEEGTKALALEKKFPELLKTKRQSGYIIPVLTYEGRRKAISYVRKA